MIRLLPPRSAAPARARRLRSRPTLDRLEDRGLLSLTGGAPLAHLAHGLATASGPRTADLAALHGHNALGAAGRDHTPSPSATRSPSIHAAAMKSTATTSSAPTVTVSSSFTSDGGYTLSKWGPSGSIANGITLWTVPGTATQEIVTVGTASSSSSNGIGVARYRTDGTFDTGYGTGGVATSTLGAYGATGQALSLRPDGTVVGSGNVSFLTKSGSVVSQFLAARFTPSGALDATFNGTGWASTDIYNYVAGAYAVGVQSTGKIVAAGSTRHPYPDPTISPVILRYTAAGKLDAGAGGFGQAGSNGQPLGYSLPTTGRYTSGDIDALAVQPDDKVVTVGRVYGTSTNDMNLTLMRFTADGKPDPTFNQGSPVLFAQDASSVAWGRAVVLQPDGKILVAGDAGAAGVAGTLSPPRGFLVARFNADGTLDPTFNNGSGSIRLAIPSETGARAHGLAIYGAGRIVVGGDWAGTVHGATVHGVAAARLNPDGTVDTTFGTGGIKSETFANTSNVQVGGLAIANDGSYYLAGYATPTSGYNSSLLVHFLP